MTSSFHLPLCIVGLAVVIVLCSAVCPASPPSEIKDLREKARLLEQAGEKSSAAVVYEQLIRQDPSQTDFLAPRIARLYAEAGWTNQALNWTASAAQSNPDPAAFRAGILALLGDYAQAETILKAELKLAEDLHRKILLYWQLADVAERSGGIEKAAQFLEHAASLAKGSSDEIAANRRLLEFRKSTK